MSSQWFWFHKNQNSFSSLVKKWTIFCFLTCLVLMLKLQWKCCNINPVCCLMELNAVRDWTIMQTSLNLRFVIDTTLTILGLSVSYFNPLFINFKFFPLMFVSMSCWGLVGTFGRSLRNVIFQTVDWTPNNRRYYPSGKVLSPVLCQHA